MLPAMMYSNLIFLLQLIHLGEDFNADFDGKSARLSIRSVYPEDQGEYTCVAYNELGKAHTSACLVVDGKLIVKYSCYGAAFRYQLTAIANVAIFIRY